MADEKKHLKRISKIKDKKRREGELEEIYLIPFLNIRYSDTQTWQEREQILDYLSERYPRFVNRGHDMLGNLEYCFATDKEEAINRFEFSAAVVRWAASHGVNLNKIYRAETVLDRLYGSLAKSNELGKEWEDERTATIHKLIPELVAMGAKTLAQIREEESATHPKYESEVEKLRLLCESYL